VFYADPNTPGSTASLKSLTIRNAPSGSLTDFASLRLLCSRASADEIIAFCKERRAAYEYPRIVDFIEALPRGRRGKILKRELR